MSATNFAPEDQLCIDVFYDAQTVGFSCDYPIFSLYYPEPSKL